MISRRNAQTIGKIEALRNRRLKLADMELKRANAAVEHATQQLSAASRSLSRTAEFCRSEHQRLNEELSNTPAIDKDHIFKWRDAHDQLRARLLAAKASVETAQNALRSEQERLEQAKQRRRPVALDVERLNALLTNSE
jgi:multidrug resistance efflux pump